jgi:hypothetical protein
LDLCLQFYHQLFDGSYTSDSTDGKSFLTQSAELAAFLRVRRFMGKHRQDIDRRLSRGCDILNISELKQFFGMIT